MTRLVRPVALLACAAVVLSLSAAAFGSSDRHRTTMAPNASSPATGLVSPFASTTGTCDPTVGYATFVASISAYHSDPIVKLLANGQATLRAYPDDVDTGGAGSVWGTLGEPLAPGDHATVQIYCLGSPTDVGFTLALYDAPFTPFALSGAVTSCPACSATNHVQFSPSATAHYFADLTLTQGSVDLSNGQSDQVFTSSGRFDLGYLGRGQQNIYLTPLAGPTAKWSISVHALPVILSGLRFDVPYIRPGQNASISYHLDGDATLRASIKDSSSAVVRTLATDLPVTGGANTLTWNGLDAGGSPVADGIYTVAMSYVDAA